MRAQDPQLGHTANAAKVNEHLSRESQESRKDAVVTRRGFLELALATTLLAGVGHSAWAGETKGGMPYRTLGRTGEKVSSGWDEQRFTLLPPSAAQWQFGVNI